MPDTVELIKHVELMAHGIESRLSIRIDAVERAIGVAKLENDRRLEGMNEFREQLREQATHFASAERLAALEFRLNELRESFTSFQGIHSGKAQGMHPFVTIGIQVAFIVLAAFVGYIIGELRRGTVP